MNYDKLTAAGIDMDGFMKRLMGNEAILRLLISKFAEDTNFEKLRAAFDAGDMEQAELTSHSLKGMSGNLCHEALFTQFTEQVNLIRKGEYEKARAMMEPLEELYSGAIARMQEWLAGA